MPRPRWVTLTPAEIEYAIATGRDRNARSHARRSRHRVPLRGSESDELNNCLGAGGELAVGKAFGIRVTLTVDTFGAPDVGPLQVRAVRRSWYRLPIFPHERDADPCVLVIGNDALERYRVVGWRYAGECKQARYLEDPGARGVSSYFVPQSELRELDELDDHPELCALREASPYVDEPLEVAPPLGQAVFPWG